MRQAAHIAVKGVSASNVLAIRTAIQKVAAHPTPDGIRSLFFQPGLIPQQAADLWEIAAKHKLLNDAPMCLAYLGYQAHKADPESVRNAMDMMAKSGFVHTEKTYELLIRAYINMKNSVGILKTFFHLVQANVEITEHGIQASVLSYFARNPHYMELVELFLALGSANPKHQYNVLYHSVINETLKSGSDFRVTQKIQQLLREMDTLRIIPLPSTFEILLHTDTVDFETALQLFNKMRKHRMTTVYAYAGMIHRNGQQGRLKECMRLWSELISHDITPTPAAYLAVMQPFAQRGRSREVTKMITDMMARGVRVSLLAYTIQAQSFIVEGLLERAVAVLDDMATHRVKPDEKLFGILMRAYLDAEDLKANVQLVERAYKSNVEAGNLLAILVSAFGDPETHEAHNELLKQIDEKNIQISAELRDAIARRKAAVPFPPGIPAFSFRQPRAHQSAAETSPSPPPVERSIPLHPPLPPQSGVPPPYGQPYPMYSYPYSYPPQVYVPYDPTQPHAQFYHYPPPPHNLPNPAQSYPPPTSSAPLSGAPNTTQLNSTPHDSSLPSSAEIDPPTNESTTNESPDSDASPVTSPSQESSATPSALNSTSPSPPPISPSTSSTHLSKQHQQNSIRPSSYSPRASLPEPPYSHSQPTFSPNSNFYSDPNKIDVKKPQSKRAELQRLHRRNERQEKKIQHLQSRNELNNFILDKLNQPLSSNQPLPLLQDISPSSSPPSSSSPSSSSPSSTSPSSSSSHISPEIYKKQLEEIVKQAQEKLKLFAQMENIHMQNNKINNETSNNFKEEDKTKESENTNSTGSTSEAESKESKESKDNTEKNTTEQAQKERDQNI